MKYKTLQEASDKADFESLRCGIVHMPVKMFEWSHPQQELLSYYMVCYTQELTKERLNYDKSAKQTKEKEENCKIPEFRIER